MENMIFRFTTLILNSGKTWEADLVDGYYS